MADGADDSGSKQKSRIKGKFVSRIKSWRSSRLKHMNKQRDVGEIENDHDYFYDKNAACPPAPPPDDVPDVALHLDVADHDSEDVQWYDGRRIVEIKHLADQLYCCKCRSHLHLSDIVNETRYGLGSVFNIICKNDLCCHTNQVSTGKRNSKGAFDINTKVAIG